VTQNERSSFQVNPLPVLSSPKEQTIDALFVTTKDAVVVLLLFFGVRVNGSTRWKGEHDCKWKKKMRHRGRSVVNCQKKRADGKGKKMIKPTKMKTSRITDCRLKGASLFPDDNQRASSIEKKCLSLSISLSLARKGNNTNTT
jgi:hypothetical protein